LDTKAVTQRFVIQPYQIPAALSYQGPIRKLTGPG